MKEETASAITVFHPTSDTEGFDEWMAERFTSAISADGFLGLRVSEHEDPRLDIAVEVTFQTEHLLHAWLDSPTRAAALAGGTTRGFWPRTSDLVLVGGVVPPPGVGVFLHSVDKEKEVDFVAVQGRLAEQTAAFSGCEGTILFPPDGVGEWMSVVRFRTAQQLATWSRSDERAAVLPELRASLTRDFSEVSVSTAFGSTVRTDNGRTTVTPDWKIFLIVSVMLYPIGMLEKRFLDPSLNYLRVEPWLGFLVGLTISVAVLQWVLMPAASVAFRRWLDPVEGAGLRTSLVGALMLTVACIAFLAVFATVRALQFWWYI